MSKNNPKTCPLKSNFAFAIIALLTAGLLLYTTVKVFNCKQDIAQINERIQNSPSFVSAHSEQKIEKQGRDEDDENVDTKNVNENKEEIIYNKNGSIDTSNWKTYESKKFGFSVKYPAKTCVFTIIMNPEEHDETEPSCKEVSTKIITHGSEIDILEPNNVFSVSFGSGVPNQSYRFAVSIFEKNNDEYYKLKFPQYDAKNIIYEVTDIKINEIPAKKVVVRLKGDPTYYHSADVFIEKDNLIYEIRNDVNGHRNPFSKDYIKFINSFKFDK